MLASVYMAPDSSGIVVGGWRYVENRLSSSSPSERVPEPHSVGPLLLLLLYAAVPRYALNGKSKLVTKGILSNRSRMFSSPSRDLPWSFLSSNSLNCKPIDEVDEERGNLKFFLKTSRKGESRVIASDRGIPYHCGWYEHPLGPDLIPF